MRFMESYESRHSDHSFAAAVATSVGVTSASLRADSQVCVFVWVGVGGLNADVCVC